MINISRQALDTTAVRLFDTGLTGGGLDVAAVRRRLVASLPSSPARSR